MQSKQFTQEFQRTLVLLNKAGLIKIMITSLLDGRDKISKII